MVKAMHAAGIEVILDVVYNHTAEGNHLGPDAEHEAASTTRRTTASSRTTSSYYMDYTGTGNSLNVRHPHSLQLIMDSLRYWVTEMHVDGFRFDLASTLAREFYDVDRLATFFELVQQDPVVSQVKLIAEPWDIGPGGYQVGGFPPQWTEWNGAYRDTVRDFWRGEPSLGEFASRVAGSSDLYEHSGRRPVASINFVTAHDGFTLRDLVSYNEKHNEANGEDNNDGESHNRSWNHGVEGPTDDPEILALRARAAAQLPGHAAAQPGRADAAARRRDRPHPGRQQQHLRPGLRDRLDALGRRRQAAGRVHRRADPSCATTTRRSAASASSPAPRCAPATAPRATASTTSSGCTSTAGRWRTATGTAAPRRSACTSTATASPARTRAAATIIDDHFLLYFNADGPAEVTLPPDEYAAPGTSSSTPAARPTTRAPARPGRPSRWRPAACSCCASTPSPRPSPTTPSPRRSPPQAGTRAGGRDRACARPASTYRLQITADFDLLEAAAAAALPARPRRRLGLPVAAAGGRARQQPRLRRRRPRPRRPLPRRRRGAGRALGRGTAARHGRARRHRAQPRRRRDARPRTPGGGTCCSTGRESRTRGAFDVDWAARRTAGS